ncbi:ABC transporter permease [Yeosuana sp. MJ-SS3]|uniref:ABC transporter permease n=1 Tax=Gilvirhabdus luticola TaxID=3079858 RepID=A0ABU3U7J2_9FLAO|nr:ABC transporter permease [Yeosuana sp. MJ-SS3]MDU8886382.1 ABC transporter permease [Yeosuana sp. MJ-SS3]
MFSLFRENIRIAINSIKSQLLRTILTVLIIAIGITALVSILSAVKALENTISSDFTSMGANTFTIEQYEFSIRRHGGTERQKINPVISYTDAKTFIDKYHFPMTTTSLSFGGTGSAEIKFENKKTDPNVLVLGVNEYFIENSGFKINKGREFNALEIENSSNVCMLGSDLEEKFFTEINPIGKTITIRGHKFKVIGTLKSNKNAFNSKEDNRVLIPIQKARSIFTNPNANYSLMIKVDKQEFYDEALNQALITFRNIRTLSPIEENNFGVERSDDLINRVGAITEYLYIAAWIIGIITIFGSSIALMNIMLVSVAERTREIGVRKAMGAKRRTIAIQFFLETIMVGQIGGILGIILGILVGYGLSAALGFSFTTPWLAMFSAFTTAFIVAIISGSFPAIKAAKLDPIESLRYE